MSYTPLTQDNLPPHLTTVDADDFAGAARKAGLILNSTTAYEGVLWFTPQYRQEVARLRDIWAETAPGVPFSMDGIHVNRVDISDAEVEAAVTELERYYKEVKRDRLIGQYKNEYPHIDTFRDYPGYNAAVVGGRVLHVILTRNGPGTVVYENNHNIPVPGTRGAGIDRSMLGEAFILPAGAWLFDVNAHWGARDYEAPADAPAPMRRGLVHASPTHKGKNRQTDTLYCIPPRHPGVPLKPAAEELMMAAREEARPAL